ncbi:pentapeptide repeat-containing protein [Polymorphobacter fuscus]|uniref:Pentapeptide repeat-containing protein n=1 Tax=Sandarakinorhabdus fusca TaxID=1439888 RepID=A0A7C9L036_9SPHN|nr:pentapeptide repeat-containing protein [Polymorphobacter fuscus]KAB7643625.1 pentapeptide repeat-containing protein [Polymorphobacter fuscus]MQT18708.1 hypothetical protein [Polymorphobacter fuscus]NJC09594.1 hypothetical protein [Polymorphobacter fuscus]
MTSWLAGINKILSANTADLKELARTVGAEPEIFYVGQDLSACDLKDQDLRGMNLTGTNLTWSNLNENTKIDPQFDPRFVFIEEYVNFKITLKMAALLQSYCNNRHYTYKAWAVKNLVDVAVRADHRFSGNYGLFVETNSLYEEILREKRKTTSMRVLIFLNIQRKVFELSISRYGHFDSDIYARLILEGIVRDRLPKLNFDSYGNIDPFQLYPDVYENYQLLLA